MIKILKSSVSWVVLLCIMYVLACPVYASEELLEDASGRFTPEAFTLICELVTAEALNQSQEGQIALAAEIINRVESDRFPDTAEEVIFQEGQYYSGQPKFRDDQGCWREVTVSDVPEQVIEAVNMAIEGEDPTEGAFFHLNPKYVSKRMYKRFLDLYGEPCAVIEDHEFFGLPDQENWWSQKSNTTKRKRGGQQLQAPSLSFAC